MLSLASGVKIFVYTRVTDMRKGFNGLSGIVRSEFQSDPTDGSLFIFINRRRDRMKLLHFDGGGYWLYYRLLEAGTFEDLKPKDDSCRLQIDATQLSMLLSGVSLVRSDRRRKRFSNAQSEHAA
jgi:transposase